MKAIIGLGNPGSRYAGTRHNVGFDVVDELAKGVGASAFRSRFQAQVAELPLAGTTVLLVKPETFMNLSGRTVRALVDFHKLPLSELLVVCDDIALPLGKLRARAEGSHGGHNGLRNIQEQLGTPAYARLKIGVDAPGLADTADHVLSKFRPGERAAMEEAVGKTVQACAVWAADGIAACMNRFNGGDEPKPKPPRTINDQRPTTNK